MDPGPFGIYINSFPRRLATAGSSPNRLEKRLQFLCARRMAQLAKRLRLDLPDPLPRDVERAADLFQRVLGSVPHAEAHLQDLFLARRQGLQDAAGLFLKVRDEHGVDGRQYAAVFDEVAQMRILFLA